MDDMSKMTSGILNLFPPAKIIQLISDFQDLIEIWNLSSEEEEDAQRLTSEPLDRLRLIRTAYMLSKLASNHSRDLRKVSDRYPQFWKLCEAINVPNAR